MTSWAVTIAPTAMIRESANSMRGRSIDGLVVDKAGRSGKSDSRMKI
jgi:hypothetical protein